MNHSKSNPGEGSKPAAEANADNERRDQTLTRIRSALLKDRLAVMTLSDENAGSDPYNSGVHRALAKAHVWNKRSR